MGKQTEFPIKDYPNPKEKLKPKKKKKSGKQTEIPIKDDPNLDGVQQGCKCISM